MKQFKIVTESIAVSEYIVTANTAQEAEDRFWDGEYDNEEVVDYRDENVETISEVK